MESVPYNPQSDQLSKISTRSRQQVTAADTKEQLAAVTAEMEDLKATNTQLRAEVEQIREAFESLKAKKKNVVSALC